MKRLREPDSYSIRAVERALQLLNCFSFQQKEYALVDFCKLTKLSKSTVFRILQTLQKHKYVAYDSRLNRYFLGMKLFELGGIVFSSSSLRKAASRFLDELEAKIHHIILMGILDEGELVYIDKREGEDPFTATAEIGKRRPPYFGMCGKTLLAFLSDDEVDDLLDRHPLKKITSRSVTNVKKLKSTLKQIRERGYIHESSEALEGVIDIAAPIRNQVGKVVAAIGTAVPEASTKGQEMREIIHSVTETAREISCALGFCGPTTLRGGDRNG